MSSENALTGARAGELEGVDVAAVGVEAIGWRRFLHARPELSFREVETARFVRETLEQIGGLEIGALTPTSVVARLRAPAPGSTVAVRADLDALPIGEETGCEFASVVPGVMHACGHDAHTAIVLGVARVLSELRDRLAGEVRFVFQHAEELPPGGAAELVTAGVMDGVDMIVGAHVLSTLESGKVAVLEGACTGSDDSFRVTIRGRGGHAAAPHEAIDPIAIAAQVMTGLQQIVSRRISPADRVVVSVTQIHGGGDADNVIPETVELGGTIRMQHDASRAPVRHALTEIATGVSAAHGATCDVSFSEGYSAVVNDPRLAAVVRDVAGPDRVTAMEPLMGGEDFSAYLRDAPGCFVFIGAGGPGWFPHHHPRFTIDERAIPLGIEILARTTLRLANDQPAHGRGPA